MKFGVFYRWSNRGHLYETEVFAESREAAARKIASRQLRQTNGDVIATTVEICRVWEKRR